ncbi:MAG: 16S rRNA (uracil(1498)-N(3))-methyltransferase [Deltaproteobacteria bacterium]|jgi:16S rRNA (uracil1498-N3)-methyltransferase|nr:16S rRNA (uracil(1498)-N(3))-methyltransferase [Deltaproteobacteria bacterium]
MHTFFLPAGEWREPYRLTGAEARHLVTVLRVKPGETVRLLDGEGREGLFAVGETGKNAATLILRETIRHEKPPRRATIALGYGRNIRRGWLLEKAVELEADGIWFWQAERSQGKAPVESKENWFARMAAGAKQSNNPYLPELRTLPGGVAELAAAARNFDRTIVLWEGDTQGAMLSMAELTAAGNSLFVLGPEGGFTEREIRALQDASFVPLSLGDRVLRWETAAMLCLGLTWWARQQRAERP